MSHRSGKSVEVPENSQLPTATSAETAGEANVEAKTSTNSGTEEDASKFLRRLSSPIYNTGPVDDDGDGHAFFEETKDDAAEKIQRWWRAVRRVRRRTDAVTAARPAFEKISNFLSELDAGRMSFDQTSLALQDEALQKAVITALRTVPPDETLAALPRASRSARAVLSSAMIVYFQSEVLQISDGDEVSHAESSTPQAGTTAGGQRKMDPVAAVLRNASALMLASIRAVTDALAPVAAGDLGARKTLIVRLCVLRSSRKYFSVSLMRWKNVDAQRVAAQVMQPYARAYATKLAALAQNGESVVAVVQSQLDQYRRALEQLVGRERAHNSLQEVELAVEADVHGHISVDRTVPSSSDTSTVPVASTSTRGEGTKVLGGTAASTQQSSAKSPTARAISESGKATGQDTTTANAATPRAAADDGSDSSYVSGSTIEQQGKMFHANGGDNPGDSGNKTGEEVGSIEGGYRLPEGQLGRLLGNERLAHEILVNPEFRIPGEEADDHGRNVDPEEELRKRFKEVMRRIFWDRLTQSLLPPPPQPGGTSPGGGGGEKSIQQALKEGVKVQARYRSEQGSFYAATVLAVSRGDQNEGTTLGKWGGAVSVDVRYDEDGIVERGVPVSRLRTSDDSPDFGPLLSLLGEVREELISLTPNNANLVGDVRNALGQDRLAEMLQDKALDAGQVQRLLWFIAGRILELQAPVRSENARAWLKGFDTEMQAAASSGNEAAIVPLLPRAFEFIFAQIEEIKRDVANAHIRLIAPYLARHGAEYERAKFEARLSSRGASLNNTKAWISRSVLAYLGPDDAEGGARDEAQREERGRGLREGREENHKELLQDAVIGLLKSKARLDSLQASLPETLESDGGRLSLARDDVDRVTLVATLCVLTRQVLARLRIGCPPQTMASLQTKLSGLLKQEGVSLRQIVEECVAVANRIASSSGTASASSKKSRNNTQPDHASSGSSTGLPPGEGEGLKNLLMGSADPKHEVFRVFFRRVLLTLKGLLAGGDVADLCVRHGLHSFVDELKPVGVRLRRLFSHNLKVHATTYSRLIYEEMAGDETADD